MFRRLWFPRRSRQSTTSVSVSSHDVHVSHNGVRRRTWNLLTNKDFNDRVTFVECHATVEVQSKNQ